MRIVCGSVVVVEIEVVAHDLGKLDHFVYEDQGTGTFIPRAAITSDALKLDCTVQYSPLRLKLRRPTKTYQDRQHDDYTTLWRRQNRSV